MKNFNKFLALGLAGASLVTGGFMLSGCDVTEDKDKTQTEQELEEQKVVSAISINADTLPSYIIKGKFSRTNIKATVTYEDNTTKVIDVTESMFSEADKTKLNYVGQYNLTVNYSGKTTTMYANVVDERYLLKEVVEANLNKDVTITAGNTISKLDMDNKIIHVYDVSDDYTNWIWLNNNVCYDYEVEDGVTIDKNLSTFDDIVNDTYGYLVLDMLNGFSREGRTFTINTIEKVGVNYILTATSLNDGVEGSQYKYYFNDDFLSKVEMVDDGIIAETYNFNYSIVNLEVPTEIKALESSATINVENVIDNLKWGVMEDYLKSDFESTFFYEGDSYVEHRYDANNKILKVDYADFADGEFGDVTGTDFYWINGNSAYRYMHEISQITKVSDWDFEMDVMNTCFNREMLDTANNAQVSVKISDDGQYYELLITENSPNGNYKFIFNNNEISRIEISDNDELVCYYTFNKTNVVLEVPDEIKALESSAQ